MKLSWKASKSYTGFVKFIGKMAGTGSPRCFYLGRDRAEAELTAAKLTVAYRQLQRSGYTGWTPESIKAVLGGPSLVPLYSTNGVFTAPMPNRVVPQVVLAHPGLRLHAAFDHYLEYEQARTPGQISWQMLYGVRCRVKFIKGHIKDRPLAEIGYDELARYVAHIAARPKSKYWGRKVGVVTAHDTIKSLRTIFDWLDLSGRWDGPKRFDRIFKVRRRNLMTRDERDIERRGVETFTVEELQKIMAAARSRWHRVVIGTALNFAMTQIELATLRRRHVLGLATDSPAVEKCRDKTDVFCRWGFVFPEVVEGLRWVLSAHRYELVFVGRGGEPLVTIDECNRRDTIQHWWYKLVHAAGSRYLPFRFLRKTAADLLRKETDRDTSEAFLAHVNDGVSKFYTNHDWDKLAAGLRLLHARLRPIFDVPEPPQQFPQMRRHRKVPALSGKTRDAFLAEPLSFVSATNPNSNTA